MSGEGLLLDPHHGQRILSAGRPLGSARAAMILVHGRGASAEGILPLAYALSRPEFAFLAPEAAGGAWYPRSFLAPLAQNEPYLSSALGLLGTAVEQVTEAGIPPERLVLLGFSQGACLALEFAARNVRRYGGIVGLTGGLMGEEGTPRGFRGSLDGTPVFLGTAEPDPHVPLRRVEETSEALERLGARVTVRVYPGMGHTVNHDELRHVRALMDAIGNGAGGS